MRPPPRRGLVLGCGGTLGAAWTVGALVALEEALGWDARQAAALVGTSAGATLAALLGAGIGVRALLDAQLGARAAPPAVARYFAAAPPRWPSRPRLRLTAPRLLAQAAARGAGALALSALAPEGAARLDALAALVDALPLRDGWVAHPATWIVALDLVTGERTALGAPHAPRCALADALAASWAIPGWFAPVHLGDRRYLDGGVASPTSADLLAPLALDEVVIVAPMASPDGARAPGLAGRVEGALRRSMTGALDRERRVLIAAGARVLTLAPSTEDLAVMGAQLMDDRRRLAAVEVALRSCRRALAAAPWPTPMRETPPPMRETPAPTRETPAPTRETPASAVAELAPARGEPSLAPVAPPPAPEPPPADHRSPPPPPTAPTAPEVRP